MHTECPVRKSPHIARERALKGVVTVVRWQLLFALRGVVTVEQPASRMSGKQLLAQAGY